MKKQILILALALFTTLSYGQLKVLSNGNVGIGNSNPSTKLVVQSSGTTYNATYANANSSSALWTLNNYNATGSGFGFGVDNTGKGRIFKGTIASPSIFMTFLYSNGYVGIGDDAPAEMFTVGSGGLFRVKSTGIVQSISGTASEPTYSFTGTTNTGIFSSGTEILNFSTGGTERMRIDASGNVAIGASTVSGITLYSYGGLVRFKNINSSYTPTLNFEFYTQDPRVYCPSNKVVFYNTTAGNYVDIQVRTCYETSDANMKENVTNIENSLEKVLQLRGVSYNWISDTIQSKKNIGFLAQEVEQIIPEAVFEVDSSQGRLLSYSAIIPYLVEAIKEQEAIINQQTALINDQETRLNIMANDLINCCNLHSPSIKYDQLQEKSINNSTIDKKPALFQNTPNPFNKKTTIQYSIPENYGASSILVFDMQGKLVKSYPVTAKDNGNIEINANELQPGMYMYSLISGGKEIDTKKMIITD